MKTLFVLFGLLLSSASAFAANEPYCNTKQKCEFDGGAVSPSGRKCLYDDGQVKSYVCICQGISNFYGPDCTEGDENAQD